jgi:nicotinate-nucleotide adenylyltransferase
MRVALYFGSFNPIHHGHLIIANHIIQNLKYNELWFIVSPQNPFKEEKNLLNANHRFHLIQLAIENESKLKASNVEFKLPKPSYTINTLTYLNELYPDYKFEIIIGSDSFKNIKNWKNAELIISKYKFIVYLRPGFEVEMYNEINFEVIKGPLIEISSTHIRNNIKNNKSIRYLVPDLVAEEIDSMNYYRN